MSSRTDVPSDGSPWLPESLDHEDDREWTTLGWALLLLGVVSWFWWIENPTKAGVQPGVLIWVSATFWLGSFSLLNVTYRREMGGPFILIGGGAILGTLLGLALLIPLAAAIWFLQPQDLTEGSARGFRLLQLTLAIWLGARLWELSAPLTGRWFLVDMIRKIFPVPRLPGTRTKLKGALLAGLLVYIGSANLIFRTPSVWSFFLVYLVLAGYLSYLRTRAKVPSRQSPAALEESAFSGSEMLAEPALERLERAAKEEVISTLEDDPPDP